jgi:hypothetical protein
MRFQFFLKTIESYGKFSIVFLMCFIPLRSENAPWMKLPGKLTLNCFGPVDEAAGETDSKLFWARG